MTILMAYAGDKKALFSVLCFLVAVTTVLSATTTTVATTTIVNSGPDGATLAAIVLTAVLTGIGGLLCFGGLFFCIYMKCREGCIV